MKPLIAVINHYRPDSEDESYVDIGHGRGLHKGRADGRSHLINFFNSLEAHTNFEYDTLIVDNASSTVLTEINVPLTHNYISLKDDEYGLTRAWNVAANFGYINGNDFIVISNDDITFNESINNLFKTICTEHNNYENNLYGVLSDGPVAGYHRANKAGDGLRNVTNQEAVSGGMHVWFMAFHRSYYEKFNINGKLFDEQWPWSGNERFQRAHRSLGASQYLVNSTLVHHRCLGSWRHNRKQCIN